MVWACDEKRGALCMKEGDANGQNEGYQREGTVGGVSVRLCSIEAYIVKH